MVLIEPVVVEGFPGVSDATTMPAAAAASDERLMDADEIESLLAGMKRPTAKMQLESLVKKLRKEAAALKIVEANGSSNSNNKNGFDSTGTAAATNTTTSSLQSPSVPATATVPAPVPVPVSTTKSMMSTSNASDAIAGVQYKVIDPFSFDAGGSMDQFVTIYLPLKGVGSVPKDNIKCQFGKDDFDFTVRDLDGTNYRLKKDNLEHDIVPEKSKYVVKANKVILKLAKVKGEYGSYDFWSKLTDPRKKEKEANKKHNKDNPMAGLNDLMREMYENGDDQTRKMIGETMLKQRTGELGRDKAGLGGVGGDDLGLGDFGDDDE
jgi:calcyclin binding protein